MNPETSLRSATLRAIAFLLGGSLAFVGLLCGALLLVSVAVSGKTDSSATPAAVETASPSLSPGAPADRVDGRTRPSAKKSGTTI